MGHQYRPFHQPAVTLPVRLAVSSQDGSMLIVDAKYVVVATIGKIKGQCDTAETMIAALNARYLAHAA